MRFRPSHFPFTEPSAEVDIGYEIKDGKIIIGEGDCLLYTSPSPRDLSTSRMPSSA